MLIYKVKDRCSDSFLDEKLNGSIPDYVHQINQIPFAAQHKYYLKCTNLNGQKRNQSFQWEPKCWSENFLLAQKLYKLNLAELAHTLCKLNLVELHK